MRPHRPGRRPAPRRAGFTLIELSIVLLVILVVAGLAAPAVGKALQERRANQATLDVVRLVRHARSASAAYGRAHLVRFNNAANGRLEVYRGENNGCGTQPGGWDAVVDGGCAGNDYCVDYVRMDSSSYTAGDSYIVLQPVNVNPVDVCYEPTGVTQWRDNQNGSFTSLNTAQLGGGVRFTLTPMTDGSANGVVRRVVLPLGGDARVVR